MSTFFLHSSNALFPTGQIVATPEVLNLLAEHRIEAFTLILRHQAGDSGRLAHACHQSQKGR
ncbi:hypothetical protein SSTU70S_05056 [Stutzerimonas stutzeri]